MKGGREGEEKRVREKRRDRYLHHFSLGKNLYTLRGKCYAIKSTTTAIYRMENLV